MKLKTTNEDAPIHVGHTPEAADTPMYGAPPTGCLLDRQHRILDSLTGCATGGAGTCEESSPFVFTAANSVDPKLLEAILGGPSNDDDAYEAFGASRSRSEKPVVGRRADGCLAIAHDLALEVTLCNQSFPGMAMAAHILRPRHIALSSGGTALDEVFRQHQDLAQEWPGYNAAEAVHRYLEADKPFDFWLEELVTCLDLEPGTDFIRIKIPGEAHRDKYLLSDESAIEAALVESTPGGREMRRLCRLAGQMAIPGVFEWNVPPPLVEERSTTFGGLTLPPPSAEPYFGGAPDGPTTGAAATGPVGDGGGVKSWLPASNPPVRFGRDYYRQPECEDLLGLAMRATHSQAGLQGTALRSQIVTWYAEDTAFSIEKLRRNCSGLSGDKNGLIDLPRLARYLGVLNPAGWFDYNVRALDLRQGVDYVVVRLVKPSGRSERLVKVAQQAAYDLCLCAPTRAGRRFRIYHLVVARLFHPKDMMSYKMNSARLARRREGPGSQPARQSATFSTV